MKPKPLTTKQQAFVDAYTGNATDAARKAGYQGSENTLAQAGKANLRNPHIIEAIEKRRAPVTAGRIATRAERQAFWTATMNDVELDYSHRLRAAELLGKSEADFVDRQRLEDADGKPLNFSIDLGESKK